MNSPLKIADSTRRSRWGVPNTAGVSIPHELSFDNICHSMEGTDILRDVSLVAKTSTVTCLLGPSGSGKTTLLRIAAGMEKQTSGSIMLDNREIGGPNVNLPPEKRGIGLVFQDYALFPHLNIVQNVAFGLAHLPRGTRKVQALQMLKRVGLDDRAEDYAHQLSGGEQQRVALGSRYGTTPGVLLMDEPFSGLDARLRDTVREETLGVLRETRATSIIVTHDPEEALRMGDQIALLHRGRLEQAGTGHELYYKPQSLFTAGFFSELNYFDGVVKTGKIDTPLGAVALKAPDGTAGTATFRVNAIAVKMAQKSSKGTSGQVISVHFSGDHDHLRIAVDGSDQAIRVRVPAGSLGATALEKGALVALQPSQKAVLPS